MKQPPTQWNLTLLVNADNPEPTQLDAGRARALAFCNSWKDTDTFTTDPKALRKALDEYEQLMYQGGIDGNVGYYYSLAASLDSEDAQLKAGIGRVTKHAQELWNELQFFTLKISKIDAKKQTAFLSSPELEPYRHLLENLFAEGAHTLTEAEERIMMMKGTTSYGNWARLLPNLLASETRKTIEKEGGAKVEKSFEEIMNLMNDSSKPVRDAAADTFNTMIAEYEKIAEAELNSILEHKRVDDLLRGYARPDSSRLQSDDVEEEVVDSLVKAVSETNDIAQQYYVKKAALLGLPRLAYHERNVDVGSVTKKYTYEQANELVHTVFGALDSEFDAIFTRLLEGGLVDAYPKKGKRGGAFCAHDLLTNPTYVLLNFTDSLRDVTTIAHEMGHAINNELIRASAVHALYFGTPTSTAEVASTFMEDFVYERLLQDATEEEKTALTMSRLNDDISTIWRQIACYRFERELHDEYRKTGYVSSARIGELFQSHMSAYMGPAVKQSAGSQRWWIYWSHIRSYFYNYSYAFGLLISKIMQQRVRADKSYVNQVKKFLSVGTSQSPRSILADIGIDVTDSGTWNEGITQVRDTLATID